MMFLMVPWMLWMPISREPNSMLALVLSFIPPLGNFVMLLRMTSTLAAAGLAGLAGNRGRRGRRLRRDVVCGEGVPRRPVDVRQAAVVRNAREMGAYVVGRVAVTAEAPRTPRRSA